MMKFKLLFKKGHSNSSAKSESNQNQQVTAAPSTATTATLPLAGAASAAKSHFENEKSSKQIKSKQQTSVKKVLNNFNKDKVENPIKNQNKVLKSSHEKIFPKEKGISSSEFSDNPIKPIEPKHTFDNLKNSVNNSTGVSSRNKFDNVSDNFNENINLAINKPHSSIPISERKNSAENSDVSPSDRKEKSNSNSSSNVVPGEILESRLGGSHALLASTAGDLKIMEYQDLKHQLDSVSNEKQMLETKINELLNYQESLKDELCKMKDIQDARLGGAGAGGATSPGGSDTPPPPLPLPTTPPPRHASAPPSIAPMEPLDAHDWDKHSSSSLSEISVACLQDRITQMEETHYCTNEELQATLQELADLQSQLVDLQHANETLSHEKSVLLESLCQQTEKLEDTRSKADTLQELLLSSNNEPNLTRLNPSERETKLVELLKSSQQEKELLIRHRDDSMAELTDLRRLSSAMKTDCERLSERVRQLESTLESRQADRVQVEDELSRSKEESSSRLLEMNRLSTLLDNARAKIEELEEDRQNLRGKSELDELLAATRKEKDGLESQVAKLQDAVSRLQCRASQQQETVLHLTQEMKVIRNNAKSSLSDMEYERDLNQKEIQRLSHELEVLQENYNELQIQVQNHLEDKRQLKSLLSETQKQLSETQNSLNITSKRLSEESSLRCIENEEWQEFQKDLLTTVRVANEFKSETAQKLESVLIENKLLKEKNRTLSSQVEKLRKAEADNNSCSKPTATTTASSSLPLASLRTSSDSACSAAAASSVLTSVMQRNFSSHDSRLSVRSLIESIENATKQAKSGPSSSLSSSTSSLNSTTGGGGGGGGVGGGGVGSSPCPSPHSPLQDPAHPHSSGGAGSPCGILLSSSGKKRDLTSSMLSSTPDIVHETLKPPPSLKSEDPPSASSAAAALLESMVRRNSQTDLSERKDPLQALVKNGGSRRNALLKWCQTKTLGYHNIDITNFSSSWNDGLALCAILHSYLPDRVPYDTLTPNEKRRNFTIAFNAAESVGIPTTLNTNDMITQERPDWNQVMAYVTSIYKHFET